MEKLSLDDKDRNSMVYDRMLEVNNPDFWFGNHKEENYQRLVQIVDFAKFPLKNSKCLDVGCGTGDFSKFLRNIGIKDYLGIDIFEPSLSLAKEKYFELFLQKDILEWKTNEKFDYVFCSGALTTKLVSDNYDFIESMIKKMWELSQVGIAFNFLTGEQGRDWRLFHYSAEKIIKICKEIMNDQGEIFHRVICDEAHFYIWRR